MTWDIAQARKRIGLEPDDVSRDDDLQGAMAVALAAAESYCDRGFLLQDDEQEFRAPIVCNLLVRRWPLVALKTLAPLDPQEDPPPDPAPVPAAWRMDKKRGIVFMVGPAPYAPQGIAPVGTAPLGTYGTSGVRGFVLAYRGGYDPLPADLEAALWMIFDTQWASTPGWGAAAGSQSGSGAIKSFAIDGMTISYDNTGNAGSGDGGDAAGWGVIPASAAGILWSYRAESAALGA
jgi:hypothetical protein